MQGISIFTGHEPTDPCQYIFCPKEKEASCDLLSRFYFGPRARRPRKQSP